VHVTAPHFNSLFETVETEYEEPELDEDNLTALEA